MNWRNVTLFSHYSQYCQCLITFLSSFGNNLWQDILHLFRMDQHYAWEYFLCIPVFPTDPGWQPVRISSWWWCICWSETPSPAPASDGLCTPPCISPSFLFYLRTRQMHTVRTRRLHLFIYSFVFIWMIVSLQTAGWAGLRVWTGQAYLSAASLFSRVWNPHLLLRYANWAAFDLVLMTKRISKNQVSVFP